MLRKRISVGINERVLIYKENKLIDIKGTGIYKFWRNKKRKYEIYNIELNPILPKNLETVIAENKDIFKKMVDTIVIAENECGLRYKNDILAEILDPGQNKSYWKTAISHRVEKVNLTESYELDSKLTGYIVEAYKKRTVENIDKAIRIVDVKEEHEAIITINGSIVKTVKPGVYAFWEYNKSLSVYMIDLRIRNLNVAGQELLTRDKVSIRANLSANYKVVDSKKLTKSVNNSEDYLYSKMQFALREVCGSKTLDDLLVNKNKLNEEIVNSIKDKVSAIGIVIEDVGIKDIILPGDMKEILNKVVEAEKVAQANVIKRREETAATRSLHNTAKLLESNSTLMRLKELEVLEKVTDKVDKITVNSGLEGMLTDLIKINK